MSDIRDALAVVETAIKAALADMAPQYGGQPAVYWRQAPKPLASALAQGAVDGVIVIMPPPDGGTTQRFIGMVPMWTGLVTIRCLAKTTEAARALFASIPEPLVLTADGDDLTAIWQRPLDLPPDNGLPVAAGIYRISLSHT